MCPFDGGGTFIRTDGQFVGATVYQQERDASIDILAVNCDYVEQDIADGLTNCVTRDGQSPPTANLPMGGYILTGLGLGTGRATSIRLDQVQDGAVTWLGTVGGTANALTGSLSPAIAAYATGMRVAGVIATTNTGASTLALNGISSPPAIRKKLAGGLFPLTGGEQPAATVQSWTYNGTYFILDAKAEWQASASIASATTVDLATSSGEYVTVTGSTGPITSLGTLPAGVLRVLLCASTPTFTYNGTSQILPGGADIIASAGDVLWFISEGAGNWRCVSYVPIGGSSGGMGIITTLALGAL